MVNRHICIIALCSLFRCFAQPEPCTTCPHYVKKTVDAPARFLFIAGLEGSGHHSLSNMFAMCVRRRVLCRHDRELGQLLHGNRSHPTGIFVYGRQAAADIAALRKRFFARLQHLRDAPRDRGAPVLYLLNVNADGATIPDAGMMSYPNFGPPDKVLHHPDMQALAAMARRADLRVLVVLRGARETLDDAPPSSDAPATTSDAPVAEHSATVEVAENVDAAASADAPAEAAPAAAVVEDAAEAPAAPARRPRVPGALVFVAPSASEDEASPRALSDDEPSLPSPPPAPAPRTRPGRCVESVGSAVRQGGRAEQQDRVLVRREPGVGLVVGVFDGHGGQEAAEHATERLWGNVLRLGGDDASAAGAALVAGFEETHREMEACVGTWPKNATLRSDSTAGTTAVLCVLRESGNVLDVAHVGDSRAVLGCVGEAPRASRSSPSAVSLTPPDLGRAVAARGLTKDHKAHDEAERQRIEAAGGTVYLYGAGRAGGCSADNISVVLVLFRDDAGDADAPGSLKRANSAPLAPPDGEPPLKRAATLPAPRSPRAASPPPRPSFAAAAAPPVAEAC
ncbi:protein serine/threonine phosphatase [Aureococcus anophagefferens]|nr:protein serine/threonine phosphatase [Aureococcus anophagefferens]